MQIRKSIYNRSTVHMKTWLKRYTATVQKKIHRYSTYEDMVKKIHRYSTYEDIVKKIHRYLHISIVL